MVLNEAQFGSILFLQDDGSQVPLRELIGTPVVLIFLRHLA
jgi:hypothetical protein